MSGVPLFGTWTEYWDPSSKSHFYYDGGTGLTTWNRPPKPPDDTHKPISDQPEARQQACDYLQVSSSLSPPPGARARARGSKKTLFHPWNDATNGQKSKRLVHDKQAGSSDDYGVNGRVHIRRPMPDKRRSRVDMEKVALEMDPVEEKPPKDYFRLAKEYVITAPFRDRGGAQACAICRRRTAYAVFFPCEHKCVCKRCMQTEGFVSALVEEDGGRLCPVCCQQIQYVVPYKDGKEAAKYWNWVEAVKPPLPKEFRHKFHMTAILLKIKSEPDSHKTWDRPSSSWCGCIIS